MHRRQALYDQHSKELLYESRIRSFVSLTNELSVPLTLINGSCQQILECGASDGFVLRQVGFIHRNALKLKDLTCLLNELRAAGAADRPTTSSCSMSPGCATDWCRLLPSMPKHTR